MKRVITALDRIGSIGALLSAIAAPCCFPLFAAVSAAAGLSIFGRYEGLVLNIFQAFALLSVIGLALSLRRHHNPVPLMLGIVSAGMLGYALHATFSLPLLYAGLFGLFAASAWNYFCVRHETGKKILLCSIITCPHCGHREEETMPTSACLFFYDCPKCGAMLKPKPGDCCVFCSYGSVACPPIQAGDRCCA